MEQVLEREFDGYLTLRRMQIGTVTKEKECEVQTCIKELDGARENSEGHTAFEELKNGGQI